MKRVRIINNSNLLKKRMMFSVAEDSYFLTYNIILILGILGCVQEKYLKDIKKISLLITILEKYENQEVIKKILTNKNISPRDRNCLFDMYYNSELRLRSITSIIFTLEKKRIINVERSGRTLNLSLVNNNIYIKFVENELFEDDIKIYNFIFGQVKRFRTIVAESFEKRIFEIIREEVWDI